MTYLGAGSPQAFFMGDVPYKWASNKLVNDFDPQELLVLPRAQIFSDPGKTW